MRRTGFESRKHPVEGMRSLCRACRGESRKHPVEGMRSLCRACRGESRKHPVEGMRSLCRACRGESRKHPKLKLPGRLMAGHFTLTEGMMVRSHPG